MIREPEQIPVRMRFGTKPLPQPSDLLEGRIACVTMNRPKVLNALNQKAVADLRAAFEDARDDSEIRGVIFTGAGDKAFIAGADIDEVAGDTPVEAEQKTRHGQAVMELIENRYFVKMSSRGGPETTKFGTSTKLLILIFTATLVMQ